MVIVLALWALASAGDIATTAEVAFTLLYLAPVGMAVWFHGRRPGILLALLATASSCATWLLTASLSRVVIAWNLACECGVFLAFVIVLAKLRDRMREEAEGRASAVAQLRHAERLTIVGQLAAGVAHELGTPLAVVGGRASLIREGRVSGKDAAQSARVIEQQAQRMTEIIRGLLTFSRRGGATKIPTDLAELLTETKGLLAPLARERNVELIVVPAPKPVMAPVEPREIQQVLGNLVVNAVQAMSTSGGGTVRLSVAKERGHARIRVEDDGPGIPPDVLPHVFDPFFTTKDVGEGTGLGLSVAFGIVSDHGGRLEVTSKLGRGAAFEVVLQDGGA